MVYRVHFTAQDLARTRITPTPMPMIELMMAVRALQDHSQPVRLDSWRRDAAVGLSRSERMVLSLIPPVGWAPSWLMPAVAVSPSEALERVRATPRGQIETEVAELAELQPIPSWARRSSSDTTTRRQLYDGLGQLHDRLLGPYWPRLIDEFTADRVVRMGQFLTGGVETVLSQANPQWVRWKPPVLEIRMVNGFDHDLVLSGQGIVLVPSAFTSRTIVDDQASPQPTVTYPAGRDRHLGRLLALIPDHGAPDTAVALLGHTRAAVLTAIAQNPGRSTTEIARITRTAPSNASQHATVLREAGLIHTLRYQNTALHTATTLGVALLNAAPHQTHSYVLARTSPSSQ
jgi:DNA-binding transcriptional ArsR family regulator